MTNNPAPEDRTPDVVMVAVTRHDVNIALQDILGPLAQPPQRVPAAAAAEQPSPVEERLAELRSLAARMRDLADEVDELDPSALRPGPSQQ